MSQAFISYHRAQRKLARLIAHRIAADGHSVWWDRGEKPGDAWSEAVSTALANAACVVVIWSKQAAASPWVLGEATAGYGKGALVSVCADRTPPPSPFDKSPVIDMQDWDGAGADVAWIRLRDPVRTKLEAAEKVAVADAPLPPARPAPPLRVGFSSAAMEPPPYVEEKRRSGGAGGLFTLLLLGGAAAGGWYWREPINDELLALRETWRPATEETEVAAIPAPPELVAATQPDSAPAAPPDAAELPAVEPSPPAEVAEAAPADAAGVIASAPRMTYDWRDAYVPPPTLRTIPAVEERKTVAAPPTARAAFTDMPPLPAVSTVSAAPRRVELHQGRFIDIDVAAAERKTDLWFAPDRTGYGLFLGVANGARLRLVEGGRANAKGCKDAVLRRNPIAVRDLQAGQGLCVRSSAGVTSAWRVEAVESREAGRVVRLVAATPQ